MVQGVVHNMERTSNDQVVIAKVCLEAAAKDADRCCVPKDV